MGFCVSAAGILAGALVAFGLSRSMLRPWIGRALGQTRALARLDDVLAQAGWRLVALLRVSPVMPFSITSYALGFSGITDCAIMCWGRWPHCRPCWVCRHRRVGRAWPFRPRPGRRGNSCSATGAGRGCDLGPDRAGFADAGAGAAGGLAQAFQSRGAKFQENCCAQARNGLCPQPWCGSSGGAVLCIPAIGRGRVRGRR